MKWRPRRFTKHFTHPKFAWYWLSKVLAISKTLLWDKCKPAFNSFISKIVITWGCFPFLRMSYWWWEKGFWRLIHPYVNWVIPKNLDAILNDENCIIKLKLSLAALDPCSLDIWYFIKFISRYFWILWQFFRIFFQLRFQRVPERSSFQKIIR